MTLAALVLFLAAPAQAPPAEPSQAMPLRPHVELGFGAGNADQRLGLIPRLRGGATLGLDEVLPGLRLGGDVALEGFITGEEGGALASSSYWEAVLTPRFLAGYELGLDSIMSFFPYAYLAVSGGMRVRTVEFLGRDDTQTDIVFGGRLGLGVALIVRWFYAAVELDAGWKDVGPFGTTMICFGVRF